MPIRGVRVLTGTVLLALAACSGGSGTTTPASDVREPAPNDRDPAGDREAPPSTRESPGPTREDPGNDRESPGGGGSTGGGGGGTGGPQCPACDATYECTVVDNGQSGTATIDLETKDGYCTFKDTGQVLSCSGTIADPATGRSFPWTPYGNGGFQVNGGASGSLTCVPK